MKSTSHWVPILAAMFAAALFGCDPVIDGEPLPPDQLPCEPLCLVDELCVDGMCIPGRAIDDSIIEEPDWFDVVELAVLDPHRLAARAVGYIQLADSEGRGRCTAWLVGRDLVLTNDHCVDHAVEPDNFVVFDYYRSVDYGSALAMREVGFPCNELAYSAPEFDLALLRCGPQPTSGRLPAEVVGSVLRIDARRPVEGEAVYLAHHNCLRDADERCAFDGEPGPAVKKISLGEITALDFAGYQTETREIAPGDSFRHTGDTLPGTSGAPVLSAEHGVIGLHHASGRAGFNRALRFDRIFADHPLLAEMLAPGYTHRYDEGDIVRLADEDAHYYLKRAEGTLHRLELHDEENFYALGYWWDDALLIEPAVLDLIAPGPRVGGDGSIISRGQVTWQIVGRERRAFVGTWSDDEFLAETGHRRSTLYDRPTDAFLDLYPVRPGASGLWPPVRSAAGVEPGSRAVLPPGPIRFQLGRVENGHRFGLQICRVALGGGCLHDGSGPFPRIELPVGVLEYTVDVPRGEWYWRAAALGDDSRASNVRWVLGPEIEFSVREPCVDEDGDGFGDGCDQGHDCDDNAFTINPGAVDECGNGIDEDCSGGDRGVCRPGDTTACGIDGTSTCTQQCGWGPCEGQRCLGDAAGPCGLCGTRARMCDNGVWSAWGACDGQGACAPGAVEACGEGGTRSCTEDCGWSPCHGQRCLGDAVESCGACGERRRICSNGEWSPWTACLGEGECHPGDIEACGLDGTRRCTAGCGWGPCEGQRCDGEPAEPCGACGQRRRTCENGVWSPWGACEGAGACSPGETQACDFDRMRACGAQCAWGDCLPDAEPRCPPNRPGCALLVQPREGIVLIDASSYRLHDGTPFEDVAVEDAGRTNLCIVTWAADDPGLHDRLTPIDDSDGDGWLEWAAPPIRSGLAPYTGCVDCAEPGLPLQWTFRRCDRDQLGDFADLGTVNDDRAAGFLYVGADNFCRERWGLSLSYDDVRGYYPSGELLMHRGCDPAPGPRACASFVVELWPTAGRRLAGRIDWYDAGNTLRERTWVLPDGGTHAAPGDLCRATVDGVSNVASAHSRAWGVDFSAQPLCPLPEGGFGARDDGECAPE